MTSRVPESDRSAAVKVGVLFNDDRGLGPSNLDAAAVEGVREAADGAAKALAALGHEAQLIAVGGDPAQLIRDVRSAKLAVAVNLIESVAGDARLEAAAAWLLEWIGVPFSGNAPEILSLGLDKPRVKAILAGANLPVPKGVLLESGGEKFEHLTAPWIVKPARLDASHGIDKNSAGDDPRQIREKAREIRAKYHQPALVEEYIEGRELNVSILGAGEGALPLPFGEIDFSKFPKSRPNILTYEAKWQEDSPDYLGTPAIAARPIDPQLEKEIRELSLTAYRLLGLRDYGRVDLRLHPERGPFILEVNPNPDLSPGAGLSRAAERGGLSHERLIERILAETIARAPSAPRR